MASASGGRARRKRRRSSSEVHESSAITSYLHRNESNFSTWQLTMSFFGPARLDTGLFVPRRLVCLLLSFLRSIPCFHEHVFLFCIVIFVLHASQEGFYAWKMGVPLSFSSPFRLHLFFFFRRVLKALPLLPYAGWHTAARVREWDRVLSCSFEISQDRGLYDILLCFGLLLVLLYFPFFRKLLT